MDNLDKEYVYVVITGILLIFLISFGAAFQRSRYIPDPSAAAVTAAASAPTVVIETVEPTQETIIADAAYPIPLTAVPTSTPRPTKTASPTPTATMEPSATAVPSTQTPNPTPTNVTLYLPSINNQPEPTATIVPTQLPTVAPQVAPTAVPQPYPEPAKPAVTTIDFAAARAELNASGQTLVYNKLGFHTGWSGNRTGIGDWTEELNAAGIPFFLKAVDDAGPVFHAQELTKQTGIDNTLVFRRTGNDFDVPIYDLPPADAAVVHWEKHLAVWPPELDPSLVWIETINEVDKNRSEWLAEFSLKTAELALRDGYKWAAFGWSSGEPEPEQWASPKMLEFLRLVAAHPDQLAIALHEYSYDKNDIGDIYPYKVGRFQALFTVADNNQIPRPTVLITEWGWEYQNIPESLDQQLADIRWANELYAPHPQIKGAAIWYLGGGYGDIHNQTQQLIQPLGDFARTNYFIAPPAGTNAAISPDQYIP